MSRPIPVEIIPSHAHLSEQDIAALFGNGYAATITHNLSQSGQHASAETVEVSGRLKRNVTVRVLGPSRKETQVELTPTEAQLLGIAAPLVRSGDLTAAGDCHLKGPAGEIDVPMSVIIPRPHMHCSDVEAETLHVKNGMTVTVEIMGEHPVVLDDVIVRVHPTYRLRLHIHPDIAREHWLTGVSHARLRESRRSQ